MRTKKMIARRINKEYLLLCLSGLVVVFSTFLFFIPKITFADTYGDMKITTKIQYDNKTVSLPGVTVTVRHYGGTTYKGGCDATKSQGTKQCSTQGIVDGGCKASVSGKTNNTGVKAWKNIFSSCHCSFSVDLSAPPAPAGHHYVGGWSPAEPALTGKFGNQSSYSKTFTIVAADDTPSCDSSCNIATAPTICTGINYANSCGPLTCPGTKDCSVCDSSCNPATALTTCVGIPYPNSCGPLTCQGTKDCTVVTPGCTNSTATNYNSAATTDDGSCVFMCSITLTTSPTTACAIDASGVASTTVTANVAGGKTATLNFGDGSSTPLVDGTNIFSHTYPYGLSEASATCTGTDGEAKTATASFIATDCPWRDCTASVDSTPVSGTGNSVLGYIRTVANMFIKLDLIATMVDSEKSMWFPLASFPSGGNVPPPYGGKVNILSENTDNPLSITQQVQLERSSGTTKPSRFGPYAFWVKGFNHGIVNTSNLLPACSAKNDVNVKHAACSATEIVSEPVSPFSPAAFTASNIDTKEITFSTKTSGVVPDGGQKWKLERTDISGHHLNPVVVEELIDETMPTVAFTFRGDYSGESASVVASREYGPGDYTLTLLATSMANSSGNSVDSVGDCYKTFKFTIVRGAEIKCTILPAKRGIAPQPIKLNIKGDKSIYDNAFKLIINSKTPVPFSLSDSSTIYDGTTSSYLTSAGKYYIAVEATRKITASPAIPNLKPCDDPSDSMLRYCGAGLCNYTVTNKDGGGGTEVAP